MAQIVHGQQRDRLGCERRGQMPAHPICVLRIGTAAFEIALVAVKRFADRNRAVRVIGAGLTARQRPRYIDGLPVGQNVLAVGGFKIVGQPDSLDPVCTVTDATYGPGARRRCCAYSPVGCRARSSRNTASGVPPGGGGRSRFQACRRAASASGVVSVSHEVSRRAENISMDRHRAPWRKSRYPNGLLLSTKLHRAP